MGILPREVFKYIPSQIKFEQESNEFWEVDLDPKYWNTHPDGSQTLRIDWYQRGIGQRQQGIYLPIVGGLYPYKGCSDRAMPACNIVKAVFIEFFKIFFSNPFFILTFLSKKKIEKTLQSFNRIAERAMGSYVLNDQYLSHFAKELHLLIFSFLIEYGIMEKTADTFAEFFVNVIDYDNAYRLRFEDIFSSVREQSWENPQKVIKRMIHFYAEREPGFKGSKYEKILSLLSLASKLPKFKRIIKKVMTASDMRLLSLDECDVYWCCIRDDFKFLGMDKEQRLKWAEDKGWTFPNSQIK